MRELARRRGWIASLVSLFVVGGFVAAPLAASADEPKDGGKKGPDVPIKIGDPIIHKDPKKPAPKK